MEDAKNGRVICTEYYDVTKRNETMKNNCRNVKVFICVNILWKWVIFLQYAIVLCKLAYKMQFCGSKRSDLILKVCYDKQNLF